MTWLSGHPGLLPSPNTHTHSHIHLYSCSLSPLPFSIHSFLFSQYCVRKGSSSYLYGSVKARVLSAKKPGVSFSLYIFLLVGAMLRNNLKLVACNTHFSFTTEGQFWSYHNFFPIVSLFCFYRRQDKHARVGLKHIRTIQLS